eukprot:781094-Pelagomonas_calceolata.AAC.6
MSKKRCMIPALCSNDVAYRVPRCYVTKATGSSRLPGCCPNMQNPGGYSNWVSLTVSVMPTCCSQPSKLSGISLAPVRKQRTSDSTQDGGHGRYCKMSSSVAMALSQNFNRLLWSSMSGGGDVLKSPMLRQSA